MADSRYNQIRNGNTQVHFSQAMFGEVESSRMVATPTCITTFNAGDIVPIYCREVLPDESIDMSLDFVIRQTTLLTPTMGNMQADVYAFFVPNRVVNYSWKAVQGENISGSWAVNPEISLAPLWKQSSGSKIVDIGIPVGSVADYYGFPTQAPIQTSVLEQCNDLKFRGYVAIYNEYFRDQNYQPPIPISYLNVYQDFFRPISGHGPRRVDGFLGDGESSDYTIDISSTRGDGSFPAGSITNALYGSAGAAYIDSPLSVPSESGIDGNKYSTPLCALDTPLKANKLHDYFTSVLPSPQKSGRAVVAPVTGVLGAGIPVVTSAIDLPNTGSYPPIVFRTTNGAAIEDGTGIALGETAIGGAETSSLNAATGQVLTGPYLGLYPTNLVIRQGAEVSGLEIDINDLRMSASVQKVYETLARGGSRYRELLSSFFGLDVDDPFDDIPKCLGHISRDLELFQTAQTSESSSGSTPQGNLAAFGYTSTSGHLFTHRFVEHGYLHVFVVVRHRNLYSTYLARDNFRMNMLDFYTPPLANIGEQPVYLREINPFLSNSNSRGFGYQEAWAEYRYEPDYVSGYMRSGIKNSLAYWNYTDPFDVDLNTSSGEFMRSNSQEVLDRTLAITSAVAPQFKGQFRFIVDKTLPMPTYSVPGLDIL
ncbi:major capsid protein [Dipodfec virus UOA04_Rod_751]|nr:major capsid protein [Dipodfec virus UOA04_Rod_751]